LEEYTTGNGIYKGFYWRYIILVVLAISALELVALYAVHYPMVTSLSLAVLIVSYVVIPRTRERRLANAIASVILTVIVGVVLQIIFDRQSVAVYHLAGVVELDALALLLGLVVAYLYLRLTMWSERRRAQVDAKRSSNAKSGSKTVQPPQRRHHSTKSRKKGKRR